MNDSTSLDAGPIDVRAKLLEIIGRRDEGISRNELSREMCGLVEGQDPFFYEKDLALLIIERQVALSFCGPDYHRTQVYALGSARGAPVEDCHQKRCYRCKKIKDVNTFRRRYDSKDGRNGQCKMCENRQRKLNGWANKARKRRNEERAKDISQGNPPNLHPARVPTEAEIKDAMVQVKAQSLKEYQQKSSGNLYIEVDGRAVSTLSKELSPIVEFNRAWKRIKAG